MLQAQGLRSVTSFATEYQLQWPFASQAARTTVICMFDQSALYIGTDTRVQITVGTANQVKVPLG
jgi:hypothetical protein